MLRKEIKKILFSKTIIVLLVSLCFINILLDTTKSEYSEQQMDRQQEYQKGKIESYDAFMKEIEKSGDVMNSFSMFSKNNRFQKLNIEKTAKAYKKMQGTKPVYGNYVAMEKLFAFGFSDIIIFVLVLQMALLLIDQEINKGMLNLLKSCRNGREKLIFSKIGAISIGSLIIILIVYGVEFIKLLTHYGLDSVNVPIQSVPGFYESNMPIMIWQYVLFYLLLKWIATCMIGIFVIGLCSKLKNTVVTYGVVFFLAMIAISLYRLIHWDWSIAFLKLLSPVTLLDTKAFTAKYLNINILQYPFELFRTSLSILLFYCIVGIVFAVIAFCRKNSGLTVKPLMRNKSKNKPIVARTIFTYEQKKILWINRVILFLLAFVMIQAYMLRGNELSKGYYEKCYESYIDKVYGEIRSESIAYIEGEQERFDNIQMAHEEMTQKYLNGEIERTAYHMMEQEYESNMHPYDAFCAVKEKSEYLQQLKKDRGIQGWFTYDSAFDYLMDTYQAYDKYSGFLMMFLVMILCMVPVFVYDEQKEMMRLLGTTYYGRTKLVIKKYMSAVMISMIIWGIGELPWLFKILSAYPPNGWQAPLQSISLFEHFPLRISIVSGMIFVYIAKLFGAVWMALFIVGISELLKNHIKAIMALIGIIIVPVALKILGVDVMEKIMFIPIVNMSPYITGANMLQWFNFVVLAVLTVFINFKNVRGRNT